MFTTANVSEHVAGPASTTTLGYRAARSILAVWCLVLVGVRSVAAAPPGGERTPPEVVGIGLLVYVVVPSVVFGGLTFGVMRVVSWSIPRVRASRRVVGPLLVGAGLLVAAVSSWPSGFQLLGGQSPWIALGAGIATLGVVVSRTEGRASRRYRFLVASVCLAVLVAGAVTAVQATVTQSLTRATTVRIAFAVPLFGLLPAGYAFARGNSRLGVATTAVAFGLPMLGIVLVSTPNVRGNGLLLLVLEAVYGVLVAVVGSPLLAVGASFAPEPT